MVWDRTEHIMGMVWDTEALIGTRLGSCVLERLIGVGGMSAVYLARQEHPHRQVAVKVVHPPATVGAEERAQFLERSRHEADAAAVLDHANIVPIYEFGENGDLAYLVMPYLAGGSLADLLSREGAFPMRQAVAYVEQMAAALDYAHAHGIVHQDVKPSNLLLHPDGRLLLADFGIARMASDSTSGAAPRQPDRSWGTPEYMAPEQITGEQITGATDTYGLGILTYTMLTGRPPFEGVSTVDVLSRQLHEAPPPLRTRRPDVPPHVEEVVSWALAKQPTDRPGSAGTFARALEEAAASAGEASMAAPQRTLGWLAAAVQPFARTITRLIFRNDAVTAAGADAAPSAQPAAGILASQRSDLPASAVPPADGQAQTWPMGAPPRTEAELDPHATRRQRNAASPSTDVSRIVVPILIGILVFLLAITRGFAQLDMPQVMPDGTETADRTPVPASNTSSSESVALTWLGVSPDHVDLDCSTNRAAEITLRNKGPERMTWRVGIAFLDGISASPDFGSLESGESVTVVVTNTSRVSAHNGVLTFKPLIGKAGRPVVVTFTTTACWLGLSSPAPNTQAFEAYLPANTRAHT
jgi:hypothetical protein